MQKSANYFDHLLQTTNSFKVWIDARGHAALDSFPLRFGISFASSKELRLHDVRSGCPDAKYPDRYHVDAEFELAGQGRVTGHFVLVEPPSGKHPGVATVWRHDASTEFGLSELMRSLRTSGYTTAEDWLAFHPAYVNGRLHSAADLFGMLLAERGAETKPIPEAVLRTQLEEAERAASELLESYRKMEALAQHNQSVALHNRSVALEAIEHVDRLEGEKAAAENARAVAEAGRIEAQATAAQAETEKALEQARRKAAETEKAQIAAEKEKVESERADAELRRAEAEARAARLEAENALLLEKERRSAEQQRQHVEISAPDTLVEVLERQMHRGSSCTMLVLNDGTRWYMKTSTFDPNGVVTTKARSLIGRRVQVTSWDPIREPGKWSSQGYFRNIYEVQ